MEPTPGPPPRHVLSSAAQPFTPSFLRGPPSSASVSPMTGPTPPPSTDANRDLAGAHSMRREDAGAPPVSSEGPGGVPSRGRGGGRGGTGGGRRRRSRRSSAESQRAASAAVTVEAFRGLLAGMLDEDVDALMGCMPEDVRQLYDTHVTHYTRQQQGGRRQEGARRSKVGSNEQQQQQQADSSIMAAALATFSDLTQDQLSVLEDFLWQMGEEDEITAYRAREGGGGHEMYDGVDGLGEGLFLHADDGLGAEEEAWLIEQMIASDLALHRGGSRVTEEPNQP